MTKEEQIQEKLQEIKNLIDGRFNDDEVLDKLAERATQIHNREGYVIFWNDIEESADLYNRLVQLKGGREEKANAFVYRLKTLTSEIKDLESK